MSNRHYRLNPEQAMAPHGTARLINAASATYGGDWSSVPHTHSYVEMFYIMGGRGQFLIEDRYYPVNTGELVLINPNVVHTEVSWNIQPLEYIVLGIGGIELELPGGRFALLEPTNGGELLSCLRSILQEMEEQKVGYEEICQDFMEIFLLRLLRSADLPAQAPVASVSGNRQCAAVRRYIDLHFKEALTLDTLAEEAHMNKFYLSHAFKREYGVSPINYVISRRISESRRLLSETDLSLSAIAQMLGFSSLSYFSQAFRKAEQLSPMEFRRKARSWAEGAAQ